MAPRPWATYEQWLWLSDRKGACADARRRGRLAPWLTAVFHDFFVRWPERDALFGPNATNLTPDQEAQLADAIVLRQNRITTWYKNHRSHARESRGVPAAVTQSLMKGKGRAPQAREVFCRMFYDDEKKAVVERDLNEERKAAGRKLNRREVLRITRARVDTMFREAGDEVRAQVDARVAEEKASRAVPPPTDGASQTPREYQNAINAAPTLIERLLEPVAQQTGWCFSVVAAGPSPENNGDIHSFAVHFGQNQSGHTLPQVVDNFRDSFIRPMVHFARGVYPREIRESRALAPVSPDHEDNASQPLASTAVAGPSSNGPRSPSPEPPNASQPLASTAATGSSSNGSRSPSPDPPMSQVSHLADPPTLSPSSNLSPLQMLGADAFPSPIGLGGNSFNFTSGSSFDFSANATPFPTTWQGGATASLHGQTTPYAPELAFSDPLMALYGTGWTSGVSDMTFEQMQNAVNMPPYVFNADPLAGIPAPATLSTIPSVNAPATSLVAPLMDAPATAFATPPANTLALQPTTLTANTPALPHATPPTPVFPLATPPPSATSSTMSTVSTPGSSHVTVLTTLATNTPIGNPPESSSAGTHASPSAPPAVLSPLATFANTEHSARAPRGRGTATAAPAPASSLSTRPQRARKQPRRPDESPERPGPASDRENNAPKRARRA